jgi:hypothetical protein
MKRIRLRYPIFFLISSLLAISQTRQANTPAPRPQNSPPISSDEAPSDETLQHTPCADQPTTRKQMAMAFQSGRQPLPAQLTGNWVEIGELSDYPSSPPFRNLNCSGERRDGKFEFVFVADGYSAELHAMGTYAQKVTMRPDGKGAIEFDVDFEADEGPQTYRCRLTKRGTLVCLIGAYDGAEFKRMKVDKGQIYEAGEDLP